MKKMEILAPAGTFETLKAVILAGADAVYLGGPAYGARAFAGNFTEEELLSAIDYAHLRGCKVYLTVNTLLKNNELAGLREYLLPYYEQGLDAVLVQDIGVLKFIHDNFPLLPIHTSTQMTLTSAEGVRLLKEYGVTRVVMARETSIAEMKQIHEETGMELEAFVHGALCYSYSGQCLFSSILGGRSGNRGRCAQPCRLPYTVLGPDRKTVQKESYILSLKDLCGLPDLAALAEAGVYSLKIEGRMKSPEYASGVVSVYRKYVDRIENENRSSNPFRPSGRDLQKLSQIGSRCGFTDTYYHKNNDPSMVTFEKPNYASTNEELLQKIHEAYVGKLHQLPITGEAVFSKEEDCFLQVSCQDTQVTAHCQKASPAKNKPMAEKEIADRLMKTGQTPFYFDKLKVAAEDDLFIPNGILNQLRRDALDLLCEKLLHPFRREEAGVSVVSETISRVNKELIYTASAESFEQFELLLNEPSIRRIYLDLDLYHLDAVRYSKAIDDCHRAEKEFYCMLPAICRKRMVQTITSLAEHGVFADADGFMVRNYEELYLCKTFMPGKAILADHNLYTWNDQASLAIRQLGADQVTLPLELSAQEIAARDNIDTEAVIYGYYPLMTTAGCVHANTQGCDHKMGLLYLKDRYQVLFPVKNRCRECCNIIYNSLPTWLFEQERRLHQAGISSLRLSFTIEDAAQTKAVLARCKHGTMTNGHYKRGVE